MTKKILLADDSVTIQKVVELTFSEGDYSVTSVSNGKLAIEKLMKDRPDIVIADIIMPEMSGYDVAEYIKKDPQFSAIPVILLTGTFEPFDEERAKKTGAEAYVTKPFDSKMLVEKVESLLAQKVKVESVEKIPPATIFQSRQEYEIPGVVSEQYIEKMKTENEQQFPKVEELQKESKEISSSIAADFIPSDESLPVETETPAEATAISGEPLPPSDFDGFDVLTEPPLPTFGEMESSQEPIKQPAATEEVEVSEHLVPEEATSESPSKEEIKEEIVTESVIEPQPNLEISENAYEGPPSVPVVPSFDEGVVEIPSSGIQETFEENLPEEGKKEFAKEEGLTETPVSEGSPSFGYQEQENVVEIEGDKEPSFFESVQPFEPPVTQETSEIVTDLSEQVMMVAEEQQKLEETKQEVFEEEHSAEETSHEVVEAIGESDLESKSTEEFEKVKEESFEEKEEKEENVAEQEMLPSVEPAKIEITPEMIESAVRKVVEELAPSIIKDIAWEVIPELANTIIKKRIEELEKEAEK